MISEEVDKILDLPDDIIIEEVVSRYFNNVFSGQINSLICEEECKAHIELDIKDKVIKLIFEKNKCKNYYDEVGIAHKAVYIDSPYVIDQMNTLEQAISKLPNILA